MFSKFDIYCICFIACRNAALHGRSVVEKSDIIIALKRYKFGYMDFRPPGVVSNVYNYVFERRRLPVFKKLVESI